MLGHKNNAINVSTLLTKAKNLLFLTYGFLAHVLPGASKRYQGVLFL